MIDDEAKKLKSPEISTVTYVTKPKVYKLANENWQPLHNFHFAILMISHGKPFYGLISYFHILYSTYETPGTLWTCGMGSLD